MSENALFCAVDWRRYRRQVDRQGQPYYIRPPSHAGAMRSIATRIVGLTLAVNLGVGHLLAVNLGSGTDNLLSYSIFQTKLARGFS